MCTRKLRLLRNKYHISLEELGAVCGISNQRISMIELGSGSLSAQTSEKIQDGLQQVIERRRVMLSRLCQDFEAHRDTLLESVEEDEYEL